MQWGGQQAGALDGVANWHRQCMAERGAGKRLSQPVYRVFGYAGTGKTTLARHFAGQIDGHTCYAAYTGKAAMVMRKSGCKGAQTIHSLIYNVMDDGGGAVRFVWNSESDAADAALIVIDEVSMVDEKIGRDLMRYGRPILVLGDPAQLPPVKGGGYFTDHLPDVMLTEIHRQAQDNPIIWIATKVRDGGDVPHGTYGESIVGPRKNLTIGDIRAADQVLVGRHATRINHNRRIREIHGMPHGKAVIGDRIICLRNDAKLGIFNGGLFTIDDLPDPTKRQRNANRMPLVIKSIDQPKRKPIEAVARVEAFSGGLDDIDFSQRRGTQDFDFGYALTTHKAQGSQWESVCIFDESFAFRDDWRRWLYTAVTRASDRLWLVTSRWSG